MNKIFLHFLRKKRKKWNQHETLGKTLIFKKSEFIFLRFWGFKKNLIVRLFLLSIKNLVNAWDFWKWGYEQKSLGGKKIRRIFGSTPIYKYLMHREKNQLREKKVWLLNFFKILKNDKKKSSKNGKFMGYRRFLIKKLNRYFLHFWGK